MFRALFLYVFPIGCVTYFPAVTILGHPDPLGASAVVGCLAPLAGPGFLAVCLPLWRLGVRRYRSTGS
jgi:ABC-2 type transport system permease protein